jgi:hypothetical protein
VGRLKVSNDGLCAVGMGAEGVFREAASELGCDDDETGFNEKLKGFV